MKNRKWLNILASLVVTLFILSLFTGIVMAQTQEEQYEKEQYSKYKQKYENTKVQFEKAKKEFEEANAKFKFAIDKRSKDELENKAKEYLIKAIDHTISYLDILKNRAEGSETRKIIPFDVSYIDAHVAQLEQLRTKVQQANTTKELAEDHKELKDLLTNIRLETRYNLEILLNHRIDNFVTKADNISTRLDAAIQNLKSKDKDTSVLEKDAANYKNLVNEAKDAQQKTSALFASHNGFASDGTVTNNKDAEAFVRQVDNSQKDSVKKLKDASRQLQDFVRDYRRLSGGRAVSEGKSEIKETERGGKTVLRGTGTLVANGTGRAVIEGNVTVTLSGMNGTLQVSSNAVVTTDGGTNQTLGNGHVKYQGFSSATITGSNIRIEVSGNNIALTATGTGSAVLSGHGTYKTEKDFGVGGEWKEED